MENRSPQAEKAQQPTQKGYAFAQYSGKAVFSLHAMGRRDLAAPPGPDGQIPGMPQRPPAYNPFRPCSLCFNLDQEKPGLLTIDWTLPKNQAGRGLRHLSLDHVEVLARQGCRGCRVLADGLGLVQPLLLNRGLTPRAPHEVDQYGLLQRRGYSVFLGNQGVSPARRDRVVNLLDDLGSGLCVTYNFRTGETDAFGTAADVDFFVADDEGVDSSMPAIQSLSLKGKAKDGGKVGGPQTMITPAHHISGDTSSDMSFDRAVKWLNKCNGSHRDCGAGRVPKPLPDRILDIGSNGDYKACGPVVLRQTKNEPAVYACLSHCWGKTRHLTTTLATLSERQKTIPWNTLPKTFQDAVAFSRRLGLRYLWIDSLCIVQDSMQDWQQQSAKMPDIYENGYLTLAASGSPDGDTGCFATANPAYRSQKVSGEMNGQPGTQRSVYVRQHVPHWIMPHTSYTLQNLADEFPILTRGWVWQERLLSRRILHFGKQELLWECAETAACECGFMDCVPPERLEKRSHARGLAGLQGTGSEGGPLHTPTSRLQLTESLHRRWRLLVEEYCALGLTKSTDVLPAISGLAAQLNRQLGDTYLAGLWKGGLPRDLLWRTEDLRDLTSERDAFSGPSWSWSKRAGRRIRFLNGNNATNMLEEYHITVERDLIGVAGANPFGEVRSASLIVTAPILKGMMMIFSPSPADRFPEPMISVGNRCMNPPPHAGQPSPMNLQSFRVSLDAPIDPTTHFTSIQEAFDHLDEEEGQSGQHFSFLKVASLGVYQYILVLLKGHPDYEIYHRIAIIEEYVDSKRGAKSRFPWGAASTLRID